MCWNHNKSIQLWNLWEQLASEEFMWVDGVAILTNLPYDREKKQKQPTIYIIRVVLLNVSMKNVITVKLFLNMVFNRMFPLLLHGQQNRISKKITLWKVKRMLSPDVILTQLEMEKDALCKVDEAYNIAVDRFMKANHQ